MTTSHSAGPAAAEVIVALSGGVDSAVAAWLLQRQDRNVSAIFMKNWEEDDSEGHCAAAADLADAERVCDHLAIELRTVNFATEYWDQVFERFLADHRKGWTPNPDVLCNREIKFDVFLDFALSFGAGTIATGHYAHCRHGTDGFRLLKAEDRHKDQTYFLYALGQRQLAKTLFPLAGYRKTEVRELARQAGIPTSEKRDSTGICFIGEQPFRDFLARFVPREPGAIETTEGVRIGEHMGLAFYTLGQRQGLGVGGHKGGSGEPWYVVDKDHDRNILIAAQGRSHRALYASRLTIDECNWINGRAPNVAFEATAKTRYRQAEQRCRIHPGDNGEYEVHFDSPQWAPTPGQSVVVYQDDECIGGGVIHKVTRP